MKFGDKLSQLRKEARLSQEELGEKLNVTRQTISKWELGQSKPDTDKLKEISKLLNVDFNQLADDEMIIDYTITNDNINADDVRPRKWLLVLLIILAIVIVIILSGKYVMDKKAKKEENKYGIFNIFGDFFDSIGDFDEFGDLGKSAFNSQYEYRTGTKWGSSVASLLDTVITNNKTNNEHIITVVFGDFSSSEPNEIKNIKRNLEDFNDYEVSLDYDENGYANKITIEEIIEEEKEKIVSDFDIRYFNSSFEIYAGTEYGTSVSNLLDKVITNNKTKEEHIINVVYGSINTTDENKIRDLKKKLDKWTEYEVVLDYDDVGFINQVTIEN